MEALTALDERSGASWALPPDRIAKARHEWFSVTRDPTRIRYVSEASCQELAES